MIIKPFDDVPVRNDLQAIAFYNTENLFDIFDDKNTHDGDFLPKSIKNGLQNVIVKNLKNSVLLFRI